MHLLFCDPDKKNYYLLFFYYTSVRLLICDPGVRGDNLLSGDLRHPLQLLDQHPRPLLVLHGFTLPGYHTVQGLIDTKIDKK